MGTRPRKHLPSSSGVPFLPHVFRQNVLAAATLYSYALAPACIPEGHNTLYYESDRVCNRPQEQRTCTYANEAAGELGVWRASNISAERRKSFCSILCGYAQTEIQFTHAVDAHRLNSMMPHNKCRNNRCIVWQETPKIVATSMVTRSSQPCVARFSRENLRMDSMLRPQSAVLSIPTAYAAHRGAPLVMLQLGAGSSESGEDSSCTFGSAPRMSGFKRSASSASPATTHTRGPARPHTTQ